MRNLNGMGIWKRVALTGTVFGLAAAALLTTGCPTVTPTVLTVTVGTCDEAAQNVVGTDVELAATANRSSAAIVITATGGIVTDAGDGTGTITSNSAGAITVTFTATDGEETATATCDVTFIVVPGAPTVSLASDVATVEGDGVSTVTLTCSDEDAENPSATFAFQQTAGDDVELDADEVAGTATFTAPALELGGEDTSLSFTCTGTNDAGTSGASDAVTIAVTAPPEEAAIDEPAGGTADRELGETIEISANTDSIITGEGGGEGDVFTFTWSVDPPEAGSFDCGEADQDPEDENTTDCQTIGFTIAADFTGAEFTVSVTVTRNSDGAEFPSSIGFTVAAAPPGCTSSEDCPEGQVCVDGECQTVACETDADCDNGLFCDGTETCVENACVAGTNPCAEGESCSEGDEAAICTPPTEPTVNFTLNADNLTGTADDDSFVAELEFNQGSGTQIPTFQTGDRADGQAGEDVADIQLNTGTEVVPAVLSGIETLNVTAFTAGATINCTNVTGISDLNTVSSTADLTFSAIQELTDIGAFNLNATTVDLTAIFAQSSTTTASTDEITLSLSSSKGGNVTISTAATNGFETLNVASAGDISNAVERIFSETGTPNGADETTTMATMKVTGTTAAQLKAFPATILTVDASGMSGGLTVGSGTTAATYTGWAASNMTKFTGSSGADVLLFGNSLNGSDFTANSPDLGDGADVVQNAFGASYSPASPFKNAEEFRLNATASGLTINFNGVTGLTKVTNESDGTANTMTLQSVPSVSSGVFPTLSYRGDNTQAAQTYDTLTYTANNTGNGDALAIDVNNRGTALNSSGTTNAHIIGAITAAGFENVTIDVADGPVTFGGFTLSTLKTLDVDASSNVTMGEVDATGATIETVDFGGVVGNVTATLDWMTNGSITGSPTGNNTITINTNSTGTTMQVTLGAGNDAFVGDTDTDCADTVQAGAGSDVIQAGDGNDSITTGSGSDIVIYDQVAANDREDITDFTAGAGGDVMKFDQSDLGLNGVTEGVGVIGAIAATFINVLTGSGAATDAAAETAYNAASAHGDGVEYILIYFNTTDNTTHIIYDADADTDGGAVLVGQLISITTQAGHDQLTTANIDSQA